MKPVAEYDYLRRKIIWAALITHQPITVQKLARITGINSRVATIILRTFRQHGFAYIDGTGLLEQKKGNGKPNGAQQVSLWHANKKTPADDEFRYMRFSAINSSGKAVDEKAQADRDADEYRQTNVTRINKGNGVVLVHFGANYPSQPAQTSKYMPRKNSSLADL